MDMRVKETKETSVVISAPKFNTVAVILQSTAPLVVERFSKKAELMAKMALGSAAANKKVRTARDYDNEAEEARYRAPDGWEGMNAAAFRAGMIGACRLVGFKMTLAKLSVFVEADAFDLKDGIPLVRVYGKSETYTAHTRNATGVVDVRSRPMYREWAVKLRVRFDADQFSAQDVYNLIARVGGQVGIGAGRPDSKASAGCGFGTFEVVPNDKQKEVIKKFNIK
jgi:hypothetical protein